MKHWTHVCIEGHCLAPDGGSEINPCGRHVPSSFCLLNDRCPHFGWTGSTAREAAFFVPLRFIVRDKLIATVSDWYNYVHYWIYYKWVKDKKWNEFMSNVKVIPDDDPCMVAWREAEQREAEKFVEWFPKAKKEYDADLPT